MNFTAFHGIGWRSGSESKAVSAARVPGLRAAGYWVLLVSLTLSLVAAVLLDGAASAATLKGFVAIHALFGAGVMSVLLYAGLSVFAGVANAILTAGEALPRLALGGAMMGILPFAQASDPSPVKPATSVARSEMQVGVYGGKTVSPDSNVYFTAPDGTDLTFENLKWKEESFKPSPYYGGRGIDWNSRMPALGLMVDFTHAKATAIRSQTVSLSGQHKGEEVPATAPFNSILGKLEFTHGLNFLTLNGVYRAAGLHRRIVPYAGIGFGFMMPHIEAWRAGEKNKNEVHGPQLTGFAAQVIGGIEWRVFKSDRRSLFTEYKLTYTTNDVTMNDGGIINANIWVNQFILGIYYTPWRAAGAAAK